MLFVCLVIVLVVYCWVRSRARADSDQPAVSVNNAFYGAPDSARFSGDMTGASFEANVNNSFQNSGTTYAAGTTYASEYKCEQCGKVYNYVDDLTEHVALVSLPHFFSW